jgi:hypothetical protein
MKLDQTTECAPLFIGSDGDARKQPISLPIDCRSRRWPSDCARNMLGTPGRLQESTQDTGRRAAERQRYPPTSASAAT